MGNTAEIGVGGGTGSSRGEAHECRSKAAGSTVAPTGGERWTATEELVGDGNERCSLEATDSTAGGGETTAMNAAEDVSEVDSEEAAIEWYAEPLEPRPKRHARPPNRYGFED